MDNSVVVAVLSLLVAGSTFFIMGLQKTDETDKLRNQYIGFGLLIAAISLTFAYLPAFGVVVSLVAATILSTVFGLLTPGDKTPFFIAVGVNVSFLSIALPHVVQNVLFPAFGVGYGIFMFASSNSADMSEKDSYYRRLLGSLLVFPFTALLLLAMKLAYLEYA